MDEKSIEKKLTPKIKEPDVIIREVKVQTSRSKKRKTQYAQYSIQIPTPIVEELNIKKGDIFIFKVPLDNNKEYSIRLKRKIK